MATLTPSARLPTNVLCVRKASQFDCLAWEVFQISEDLSPFGWFGVGMEGTSRCGRERRKVDELREKGRGQGKKREKDVLVGRNERRESRG